MQCKKRQNKLITAAHCVQNTDGSLIEGENWHIALKVERIDGEIMIESKLKVTIKARSVKFDWAVLVLEDNIPDFAKKDCLEICPLKDLPKMVDEQQFKIYHCPAEEFNSCRNDSLEAAPTNWIKPLSISKRCGKIQFQQGLYGGSSGGAVVMKDKRVVAMHLWSDNAVLNFDEASLSSATMNDTDDCSSTSALTNTLKSVANSGANSHNSSSTSRILSFDEKLITALSESPNTRSMNGSIVS